MATIGNDAIEATEVQHNTGFPIYVNTGSADLYTASSGDTIDLIEIYGRFVAVSATVEVGVWDVTDEANKQNIAGAPLVGTGNIVMTSSNAWTGVSVSIALTAGKTYALGFQGAVDAFLRRSTTDAVDYCRSSATGLGALSSSASPFPTATGGTDRRYSLRANVTNSGTSFIPIAMHYYNQMRRG